jgi:hypothetical protein
MGLAFWGEFLTTKKPPLAFVLIFVLISAKSAERMLNQLPVRNFFAEKVKRKKKMSKNIFEDTTVEIIVDPDKDEVVPAAILANAAPVIPTIDLCQRNKLRKRGRNPRRGHEYHYSRPNSRASL